MSRNRSRFLTMVIASFLLLSCAPNLLAQQAPEGRKWIISNPKFIELTSAGVHILPSDAKQGSNSVETAVHLPAGKPWKIAFDVQMGPTLLNSMSIHLLQGKTDVAWLGADSYYKSMSAFVGSGNANMPFSQPWDTNWHSFAYISDGKTLSLWHNGVKCGEGALTGTPDTLEIVSTQLELRVRNVHIGDFVVPPLVNTKMQVKPLFPSDISETSPAASPAVTDNSKASLQDTQRWICNIINKSAGTFYRNGTSEQSYSDAVFDGNDLVYSGRDDIYSLIDQENVTAPLDKMDSNKVEVSQINAGSDDEKTEYDVIVNAANDMPSVSKRYKIVTNSEPESPEKQEYVTKFGFSFRDLELASRFAKAIRHAILLSKASPAKEPF